MGHFIDDRQVEPAVTVFAVSDLFFQRIFGRVKGTDAVGPLGISSGKTEEPSIVAFLTDRGKSIQHDFFNFVG